MRTISELEIPADAEFPYGFNHHEYINPVTPPPRFDPEKWKRMIRGALLKKVYAGNSSRKPKQPKNSRRERNRKFFNDNPEVKPWPMRPHPTPHPFGKMDFSKEAKKERRNSGK